MVSPSRTPPAEPGTALGEGLVDLADLAELTEVPDEVAVKWPHRLLRAARLAALGSSAHSQGETRPLG